MTTLNLSQHLVIKSRFSISVEGETDDYFGQCDEYGNTSFSVFWHTYFALTEKAKEVWKGETKEINGVLSGMLKYVEEV